MAFEYAPECSAKVVPLQLHLTILLEKFRPMFDFMRYFLIFIMADCDSSKPTDTQTLRQRRLREGAPFVCLAASGKDAMATMAKGKAQGPEPSTQLSPESQNVKV